MVQSTICTPGSEALEELIKLANELNLTALAEALPHLLDLAEKSSPSFTDFALQMLRTEVTIRHQRRIQRLLKRSKMGTVEGLDGFDFNIRPRLDPRVVKELLNCKFVSEHRNVINLGKPGLGKTRIAKAILHAACLAGYSARYVITAEMIEDLYSSKADGTFTRALRRYVKPDILCLDEFGYQPFTIAATTFLFRVVSARYRTGSIILNANTGFKHWKGLFPTEAIAVATVDRLVDEATILRYSGKTSRKPRQIVGAPLEDE
jgi:DNA replication protein DnaC